MMIVHSFNKNHKGFEDYEYFINLFGIKPGINELTELPSTQGLRLIIGWIVGNDSTTTNH